MQEAEGRADVRLCMQVIRHRRYEVHQMVDVDVDVEVDVEGGIIKRLKRRKWRKGRYGWWNESDNNGNVMADGGRWESGKVGRWMG